MKTLINKQNPAIRITAPEIGKVQDSPLFESYYTIKEGDGVEVCLSEPYWTLVENGELSIEGLPWPEEEPVDLEKETKKWWKKHLALSPEKQLWMDAHQSVVFARHFYELGRKGGGE